MLLRIVISSLLLVAWAFCAEAKSAPWLNALGKSSDLKAASSIDARASVTVSDGFTYSIYTSWQDTERMIFHRDEPDRSVTMAVEGFRNWATDGKKVQALDSSSTDFIRGHQYHAMLIHPDKFGLVDFEVKENQTHCNCSIAITTDTNGNKYRFDLDDNNVPRVLVVTYREFGEVRTSFNEWQKIQGIVLPLKIEITDADRRFDYQYSAVTLNDRDEYRNYLPSPSLLNDEQKLYRLHRDTIDAHIMSDESLMHHIWAEEVTVVNRGRVTVAPGPKAAQKMNVSLSKRKHQIYRDLEPPRIEISDDGSMAWITARVEATGNLLENGNPGRPFRFVSAWVALFQKRNDQWVMTGNVSNFE